MELSDKLKDLTEQWIVKGKSVLDKNTATVKAVTETTQLFLCDLIQRIQKEASDAISGPEKKAAVMASAEKFFDAVIGPVFELPYIPLFLQPYLGKYVKKVYLLIVSGTVDSIVSILKANRVENFTEKETNDEGKQI